MNNSNQRDHPQIYIASINTRSSNQDTMLCTYHLGGLGILEGELSLAGEPGASTDDRLNGWDDTAPPSDGGRGMLLPYRCGKTCNYKF